MTTIYICGGETNHDGMNGFADTQKIKTRLKTMKCSIVNPAEMTFGPIGWSETLHQRIELLKKSHAIYVLPNWKDNIMARIELTVAMDMKLHTFFHPVSNKELKEILTTLDG